jgi:hypothetical protein
VSDQGKVEERYYHLLRRHVMTRRPAVRLVLLACCTFLLSAALGAATNDVWHYRFTSPGRPIVRCKFTGAKNSRATLQVLRVIYGDYRRDTVELDTSSIPWGAPRSGEVILYLVEASRSKGQPSLCRGYVWQDVDADEKEAARVICAGEHMAPACDGDTLVMYFANIPPNVTVRATLVSADDKASHWKVAKVLLPKCAAPRPADSLTSLGYLNSPKPAFPPPSAAPIPTAGESIVVRADAWQRRAETMVRYSDPDKPVPTSAAAVAAKFKEIASKELVPGREAILFLTDSGRLDDRPAYDAVVVIPPPSPARGEIEKAEKTVFEAADRYDRLTPL